MDRHAWEGLTEDLQQIFKQKTRDEWCGIMEGSAVCFAPVLSMDEAPEHPHNRVRGTFVERDGVVQPAPAPRFSRSEAEIIRSPAYPGQHTDAALSDWGFSASKIADLRDKKGIA